MQMLKRLVLSTLALSAACAAFSMAAPQAEAAYYPHQRYTSWSYSRPYGYYYRRYYYKPYASYPSYRYHYNIYYPSRSNYVYYYNPYRQVYWGRYDFEQKGYSLLPAEAQKSSIQDIPESAFPQAGQMPPIPESEGTENRIAAPSADDLPQGVPGE